ncbi:MAG TPA: NAD-dependent epimerase/dehydratase family protein [Panacibacter sp.]|nr:NAD-dependent epimerase/dehydratase family protein [Panacibacter sp.]HNP44714.1 NAD-dependent epimerase/dehydratase family protein [Panacibacter sp.]
MNSDNTNNILVTGATGLVGSCLLELLLQQGKKVTALYRNTIPAFPFSGKLHWVKADVLEIDSLEEAMQNVQQVYHCAAIVSFNPKQKELLNKVNVEGTANVVNACLTAGVKKLLHVSSVSALGRIRENTVIDETMNWSEESSNSEYGKTKFRAEMEVWRGIGEGLQAVMVNPTIILGAADWEKGSSAIFKNVYNEFPWYTEGVTGFVDVQDVARAMIMLMESDISAQRFIISADNLLYRDLFTMIANAFGKNPPHKKVTPFIAGIVWRLESLKALFSGKQPLLTKETAATAQAKVYFDNKKLLQFLPAFKYNSMQQTVQRVCAVYKQKYQLK